MMLDFWLFGNGHGLKSPRASDKFYWLVCETSNKGKFYNWSGWYGSQLSCFQWTHPKCAERRRLMGRDFRCTGSRRKFIRVRTTWTFDPSNNLDEANTEIRQLESELNKL